MMRYQRRCSITEHSFSLTIAAMKRQYAESGDDEEENPFGKIDYSLPVVVTAGAALNEHFPQHAADERGVGKVDFKPISIKQTTDWQQVVLRKPVQLVTMTKPQDTSPRSKSLTTSPHSPLSMKRETCEMKTIDDTENNEDTISSSCNSVLECLEKAVEDHRAASTMLALTPKSPRVAEDSLHDQGGTKATKRRRLS